MSELKPKRPKGLRLKDVRVGSGPSASKGSVVLVHYDCFLPRGERLDSSRDRPYPAQFQIGRRDVVPALEHGVLGMSEGGLRSIRVSPQLTYFERERYPDLPEGAALRYEIELVQSRRSATTRSTDSGPPPGRTRPRAVAALEAN